jgi:prepilin-type N-terminal cleavage/methylation domain-containing protein
MKSQAGYTLVELMIVVVISTIIALVAGILVVTANRQMQQGMRVSNLQQDLAVITETLQNQLREGISGYTAIYDDYTKLTTGPKTNVGTCIEVKLPFDKYFTIFKDGRKFGVLQGGTPKYLVNDGVDSLLFYYGSGYDSLRNIFVNMRLSNGTQSLTAIQRFYLRN